MRIIVGLSFWGFALGTIQGQAILQRLGGIRTGFAIASDTVDFKVVDQALIQRAVREQQIGMQPAWDGVASYGYGLGYRSLHLEFIAADDILTRRISTTKMEPRSYYGLSLYDEADNILANIELQLSAIQILEVFYEQQRSLLYSINLRSVPVLLLDRATKIKLVRMVITKK